MDVPPYPATAIATWFISRASAGEPEPSSLKLHTLVGRAQGHYLARYGRALLAEPAPAYHSGGPEQPAVPAASTSGARLTGPQAVDAMAGHDIDPATASFLGEVWDGYGGRFADVKLVIPAVCTAD
jgi:uncharacterized phage-associated protein